MTRLTVWSETPASAATCLIVTACLRLGMIAFYPLQFGS
jgi:hypothetical protein